MLLTTILFVLESKILIRDTLIETLKILINLICVVFVLIKLLGKIIVYPHLLIVNTDQKLLKNINWVLVKYITYFTLMEL